MPVNFAPEAGGAESPKAETAEVKRRKRNQRNSPEQKKARAELRKAKSRSQLSEFEEYLESHKYDTGLSFAYNHQSQEESFMSSSSSGKAAAASAASGSETEDGEPKRVAHPMDVTTEDNVKALFDWIEDNVFLECLDLRGVDGHIKLDDVSVPPVAKVQDADPMGAMALGMGLSMAGAAAPEGAVSEEGGIRTAAPAGLDLGFGELPEGDTRGALTKRMRRYRLPMSVATTLSDCFGSNRSLTALNLSRNQITGAMMEVLAEGVQMNMSIWNLNLSRNLLDVRAARAIGNMLTESVGVTHLNLRENPYLSRGGVDEAELGPDSDPGGDAVLHGLNENGAVYVMCLAGCGMQRETIVNAAHLLRRNRAAAAYKMAREAPEKRIGDEQEQEELTDEEAEAAEEGEGDGEKKEGDAEGDDKKPDGEAAEGDGEKPEGETDTKDAGEGGGGGEGAEADGEEQEAVKEVKRPPKKKKEKKPLLPRETIDTLLEVMRRKTSRADEASFYEYVLEFVNALTEDQKGNFTSCASSHSRIKDNAGRFKKRETTAGTQIHALESTIFGIAKEMIAMRKELASTKALMDKSVKRKAELERTLAEEEVEFQEQVQQLQQDMVEIGREKEAFKMQRHVVTTDYELLRGENATMRTHLQKFQNDLTEVLKG